MGSAQSARRIQPGGVVRPCRRPRRIFPAPRSSRPLHPSFLPRRPSVSLLSPFPLRGRGRGERGAPAGAWGGGRGRGWGRRGTAPRPATGRRRAHFHRGGAPRPAPGRLGRPGGEGGSGGPRSAVSAPLRVCVCVCLSLSSGGRGARARARGVGGGAGGPTPPSVTAPRQQRSPNPGAEGARPVAALSPLPALTPAGASLFFSPPRGGGRGVPPPRGRAGVFRGGRAAPPTARPLPHPSRPRRRGARGGGADCPQCAPGEVAPSGPGGFARRHAAERSERTGSAAMSATHPTRLETRTKESNTCASQGLARKPPWRNEGEGPAARPAPPSAGGRGAAGRGGIPRPLQSAEGAPPARLARPAGEVEHERTC